MYLQSASSSVGVSPRPIAALVSGRSSNLETSEQIRHFRLCAFSAHCFLEKKAACFVSVQTLHTCPARVISFRTSHTPSSALPRGKAAAAVRVRARITDLALARAGPIVFKQFFHFCDTPLLRRSTSQRRSAAGARRASAPPAPAPSPGTGKRVWSLPRGT